MSDVKILKDELYPYYLISERSGDSVGEVPAETLVRWKSAMEAFEEAQAEMAHAFAAASNRDLNKKS